METKTSSRSETVRPTVSSAEVGSNESGGCNNDAVDQVPVFPDPWEGDWNDAVINWAYWNSYENKQRKSKGKESPEMGPTNVNRDT
jgi:hypothetical protein